MLAFAFVATSSIILTGKPSPFLLPCCFERFKISATTYSHIIFAFMLPIP